MDGLAHGERPKEADMRRSVAGIALTCALLAAAATCTLAAPRGCRDDRKAEALLGRSYDRKQISLRVEKSRYRLSVIYRGKAVKTYPVVFGRNPIDDKLREGDGRTPEGTFHVQELRAHRYWRRFLWLDYPTADSWRKHRAAKRAGTIRQDATIGGEIGIHGVPNGADDAIERRQNWTLGCISLRNADIEEVYAVCRRGTAVTIVH
jgi:murein L,D-transpeptidase YafK